MARSTGLLTEPGATCLRPGCSFPKPAGILARFSHSFTRADDDLGRKAGKSAQFCSSRLSKSLSFTASARRVAAGLLALGGMIQLNSGFGDYSADDLAHLGETVAAALPGITIFAALEPTPAEILAAATALRNAMAVMGPARRRAVRAAFYTLSRLLADVAMNAPQVDGVTDTDLAATRLPVAKTRTRETQPPGPCGNLRLRHGFNPGEVLAVCDPAGRNIRLYDAQYALDPNQGPWSEAGSYANSRAFKFDGLQRGKDTWFRVRARNTVGAGSWSDPATIMVT